MITFQGGLAAATDWSQMGPKLIEELGTTLYMVGASLLIGGLLGLAMGLALYLTRRGNLFENAFVFNLLNVIVNFIRPIPFIIFITAMGPITQALTGTILGPKPAIVAMSVMTMMAFSRLVEQNLVSLDPGVIEASRAMGASRWRVIRTVIIPEALGPLILGFTFLFIGVVDMSAMAGAVGAGGLGDLALRWGYQRMNWEITFVTLLVIVAIVQAAQFLGNWLARRVMRR
ncbi:methionine ABC transporter permease [Timonella senegalensis]|jgi:D-methionine transport system permease protein|uniref:methionine ABC transporter permease n=2 Tax=Timonella senegalensis TaxID=1465825 RepID=UPI0003163946|nr:ABC transporter permease subunit [Timonella senegalensis]